MGACQGAVEGALEGAIQGPDNCKGGGLTLSGGLVAVDGSGNVQVASPSGLPVGDFTVEVYAIWDGLAVEGGILGVWDFPGQFSWLLSIDSLGRPGLRYSYDGSTSNGPVQPTIGNMVATELAHLAFSVTGGTEVQFYMHGKKLGEPVALAGSGNFFASSAPLDWGRDGDNSIPLTGDVGPTRIWDRVLQPQEVLENFHLDTVDLSAALQADVNASWNMQSSLEDSIGSNDAALTGTATQTDDAATYPAAYAFTWSTTQTDWRDLLGFALEHGYIFEGALPFTDMAGSADVDVDGALDDELSWGGRLGSDSIGSDATTGGHFSTTATGVLSPSTNLWSVFCSFNNGVQDATNSNRCIFTTNGTGSGLRLIIRNNTTVEYLNPTAENSAATARSAQINSVIGANQNIDMLFSRTSTTQIDVWAAVEGSGTVYHEEVTIGAAEDFDEGASALRFGGATPGNMLGGSRVKAFLFARFAGSADHFDLYRDKVRTSIVEA